MKRWLFYIITAAAAATTAVLVIFVILPRYYRMFEHPTRGHCSIRLNRSILDQSLEIGTQFLLNHQSRKDTSPTNMIGWTKLTLKETVKSGRLG